MQKPCPNHAPSDGDVSDTPIDPGVSEDRTALTIRIIADEHPGPAISRRAVFWRWRTETRPVIRDAPWLTNRSTWIDSRPGRPVRLRVAMASLYSVNRVRPERRRSLGPRLRLSPLMQSSDPIGQYRFPNPYRPDARSVWYRIRALGWSGGIDGRGRSRVRRGPRGARRIRRGIAGRGTRRSRRRTVRSGPAAGRGSLAPWPPSPRARSRRPSRRSGGGR